MLQMGGCFSSDADKQQNGTQGSAGGSHKGKHHNSGGGAAAQKTSKTPDFGLGDAYEVCADFRIQRWLLRTQATVRCSSCNCSTDCHGSQQRWHDLVSCRMGGVAAASTVQ